MTESRYAPRPRKKAHYNPEKWNLMGPPKEARRCSTSGCPGRAIMALKAKNPYRNVQSKDNRLSWRTAAVCEECFKCWEVKK